MHKRSCIAKAILSKVSNSGGFLILDFNLYYRAIDLKLYYSNKNSIALA
jgi:hypothetical protein